MPDDIAELFAPPPPGPAQPVGFRQGVVVAWDPVTAANTVDVGGTLLTNLPILNTSEALLLEAGSVVSLLSVGEGAKTLAILGRYTLPGTDAAVSAMAALGRYTASADVNATDTITSTTYADAPVNLGPEVVVDVRASGLALVLLSAELTANTSAGQVFMSFAVTGSNGRVANDAWCVSLGTANSGVPAMTVTGRVGATVFVANMGAGSTTFTAQYRRLIAAGTASVFARNITVIPL